jgi:hypothetical protein
MGQWHGGYSLACRGECACAGSVAAVSRRGKRGRSVGGLPSPRREFGEAAVWPVVDELAEHVGQIGFGVYAVQFARFDQRRENGPVLGAQVVAGKRAFFLLCQSWHNRKNFLFAGADAGGEILADAITVIETAKLSDCNPEAYLADILARIRDHDPARIDELLPWNWKRRGISAAKAA